MQLNCLERAFCAVERIELSGILDGQAVNNFHASAGCFLEGSPGEVWGIRVHPCLDAPTDFRGLDPACNPCVSAGRRKYTKSR